MLALFEVSNEGKQAASDSQGVLIWNDSLIPPSSYWLLRIEQEELILFISFWKCGQNVPPAFDNGVTSDWSWGRAWTIASKMILQSVVFSPWKIVTLNTAPLPWESVHTGLPACIHERIRGLLTWCCEHYATSVARITFRLRCQVTFAIEPIATSQGSRYENGRRRQTEAASPCPVWSREKKTGMHLGSTKLLSHVLSDPKSLYCPPTNTRTL